MQRTDLDVYDLDGTVFKGNTFSLFTLWMFKQFVRQRFAMAAGRLLVLVALRKTRRISHHELKERVVALGEQLPTDAIEAFVAMIAKGCRDRLDSLRRTHGVATRTVLATAAPDLYAKPLASVLGFDHVVASGFHGPTYVETIRERKRDEVLALMRRLNGRVSVLFTDHIDDLSLAEAAISVVLVDAVPETVALMAERGIDAKTMSL